MYLDHSQGATWRLRTENNLKVKALALSLPSACWDTVDKLSQGMDKEMERFPNGR